MPNPVFRARPRLVSGLVTLVSMLAVTTLGGCWHSGYTSNRGLHYVDGELVETQPPAPGAYEAYIRARLALDRGGEHGADLEAARGHILDALRWQPNEPQLWTVKAEIEWQAGDFDAAERALARALELRPGYPEAQRILAEVRNGPATTAAARPSARRAAQ